MTFCREPDLRAPVGLGIRRVIEEALGTAPGCAASLIVQITELVPAAMVGRDHFRISGGDAIRGIVIRDLEPLEQVDDPVAVTPAVIDLTADPSAVTSLFRLCLDKLGDFSTYVLHMVLEVDDPGVPSVDPLYRAVEFNFRLACGETGDCAPADVAAAESIDPSPVQDREGKDFAAFKRFMEERVALAIPDWPDRSPASHIEMIIEQVAAMADELSYAQDRVFQEAWLTTARHPFSILRHAQLHDYEPDQGRSARTVLSFTVDPDDPASVASVFLDPGTQALGTDKEGKSAAFETEAVLEAFAVSNVLTALLTDTTDSETVDPLPPGDFSTDAGELLVAGHHELEEGRWVVFDDNLTQTAVQLSRDGETLELKFRTETGLKTFEATRLRWSTAWPEHVAVDKDDMRLFANSVMATHGASRSVEGLEVDGGRVSFKGSSPPSRPVDLDLEPPESPEMEVTAVGETWTHVPRLVLAGPFDQVFSAFTEEDGTVNIEFGDGEDGAEVPDGSSVDVEVREGLGRVGNLSRGSITELADPLSEPELEVTNRLPCLGGKDAETSDAIIAGVRSHLRQRLRAVTLDDYRDDAADVAGVRAAAVARRWTGSLWTIFVYVLPDDGAEPSDELLEAVRTYLESRRMLTQKVCVAAPRTVPLLVDLEVCIEATVRRADITTQIHELLLDADDGVLGVNVLGFGSETAWSDVVEAVESIPGVRYVLVRQFRRLNDPSGDLDALDCGRLSPNPLEVFRLDNDASEPGNGLLEITYRQAGSTDVTADADCACAPGGAE